MQFILGVSEKKMFNFILKLRMFSLNDAVNKISLTAALFINRLAEKNVIN